MFFHHLGGMTMQTDINALAADTIRMLAVDAVQKAASGHPGMPMGCADFAYVLWTRFLRHNPDDPEWMGRDRFILSAGHGSMLLYAMLHLSGYDISLDDIKDFRQWGSKTPGHPEYDPSLGIETTTGPLGQGFAMGVGMAVARRLLAERFGEDVFRSRIYAVAGDGCLMEGVSSEAASLAGHLGLGELIYFYDDNRITIEGSTSLTVSEDVEKRFEACGWHVLKIDGHDHEAIARALTQGIAEAARPTLIIARTHIAFGSPGKQDSAASHGAPLGDDEVKATKRNLGWPLEPAFYVPDEVRAVFEKRKKELLTDYEAWQKKYEKLRKVSKSAAALDRMMAGGLPEGLLKNLLDALPAGNVATRKASGAVLQALAEELPGLIGGSADLGPSNNTELKEYPFIAKGEWSGRNIHFGVREFAMGAALNGMALYGGIIPFGGTFLVFLDYMRPAVRLAALMGLRVVYVFTHDSIYLGEDGPTHQPVEHVADMRIMPNLTVIRPADAAETAAAWVAALGNESGPTALVLTRQGLPRLPGGAEKIAEGALKGAYVLADAEGGKPDIIIIATGSEVSLALEVKNDLDASGTPVRVVSMPSMEIFEKQDEEYREDVLPAVCGRRVVIEAGVTFGWERYAGKDGIVIGIDRFGASAPGNVLGEKFGFTKDAVLARIRKS